MVKSSGEIVIVQPVPRVWPWVMRTWVMVLWGVVGCAIVGAEDVRFEARLYNVPSEFEDQAMLEHSLMASGVVLPEGSELKWLEDFAQIYVRSTPEGLASFDAWLGDTVLYLELDLAVVAFSAEELRKMAASPAGPTSAEMMQAYRAGGGRFLGLSRVATLSGVNAQMESVVEIMYPDRFETSATGLCTASCETRELGTIHNITANSGMGYINVTMVSEWAPPDIPPRAEGGLRPNVEVYQLTTVFMLRDGQSRAVLVGKRVEHDEHIVFVLSASEVRSPLAHWSAVDETLEEKRYPAYGFAEEDWLRMSTSLLPPTTLEVTHDAETDEFVVTASATMHELLHRAHDPGPAAAKVELRYSVVNLPRDVIGQLLRDHEQVKLDSERILQKISSGDGIAENFATFSAASGVNAQTEAVTEVLYPVGFKRNDSKGAVVTDETEIREVGFIVNATPNVWPGERLVSVTSVVELCEGPLRWQTWGLPEGECATPVFASRNVTSAVVVVSGETMVLGACPTIDRSAISFFLLEADLVQE